MNEHKNIITIEDEIKEFSDKPVKSSALFKALEEKGVPDSSEASAGDVLSLDEDKKPTWATPSGGGGDVLILTPTEHSVATAANVAIIRLCPMSVLGSIYNEEDGCFIKSVFINIPSISLDDTEWTECANLVFVGSMGQWTGTEAILDLTSDGGPQVFIGLGAAIVLRYVFSGES